MNKKINNKVLKKKNKIILIFGNDNFLLQENLNKILKFFKKNGFNKSEYYNITKKTNWNEIYNKTQSLDLFTNKNIILEIKKKENTEKISKKLIKLFNILHQKITIILIIKELNRQNSWYKKIKNTGIFINSSLLEEKDLMIWMNKKIKKIGISLDKKTKKILCYYYERNTTYLNQILENINMAYKNENITIDKVKKIINYSSNFKYYHWIESIFFGNTEKSIIILKKLKQENHELILILYSIQKELFIILKIKKEIDKENIEKIFNKYKIWKIKKEGIKKIIKRISINKIIIAIILISKIELKLKKGHKNTVWNKLEILSIFLCEKKTPDILLKILRN